MKRALLLLFAAVFAFGTAHTASGQPTSSHDVTVSVAEVASITAPSNITIDIGGNIGSWVSSNTVSYDVTTNGGATRKITASLGSSVTGLSLRVSSIDAPSGATSQGPDISLSTSSTDLVTGVSNVNKDDLSVTYEAKATAEFDPSTDETVTVTYTLTAGSGGGSGNGGGS